MDIGDMSWRSMSAIVDKLALASEEPVPAEALDREAGRDDVDGPAAEVLAVVPVLISAVFASSSSAAHPRQRLLSADFFSWLLANTSFGKDSPQLQQVGMVKGRRYLEK